MRDQGSHRSAQTRCWIYLAIVAVGMAALTFRVTSRFSWATPSGLYAPIGWVMLLPAILLGAATAFIASTLVVLLCSRVLTIRFAWGLLAAFAAGCLGVIAFFLGFGAMQHNAAAWSAMTEERIAAIDLMHRRIDKYVEPFEAAFANQDIEPVRAALAERDSSLALASPDLVCMFNNFYWHDIYANAAAKQRQTAYIDQVADLAWQADPDPQRQRAVIMLAINHAARLASTQVFKRWVERWPDHGPSLWMTGWYGGVRSQLLLADCETVERGWPMSMIAAPDAAEKIEVLLQHGMRLGDTERLNIYSWGPLSPAALSLLSEQGIHPHEQYDAYSAPLAQAIRFASVRSAGSFTYTDDQILAYIRGLLREGAQVGDAGADHANALDSLTKVKAELVLLQTDEHDATADKHSQDRGSSVRPHDIDMGRTALMKQIEEVLDSHEPVTKAATDRKSR